MKKKNEDEEVVVLPLAILVFRLTAELLMAHYRRVNTCHAEYPLASVSLQNKLDNDRVCSTVSKFSSS